jgi:starch synthase
MDATFRSTAGLIGVHNLPYLGSGAQESLLSFGLPPLKNSGLPWWAQSLPLPVGLASADHIVTVSPNYAREILTPEFGSGLETFLKTRVDSISGILNGIDISHWSPEHDECITYHYSEETLEKRRSNKTALTQSFGLDTDPRIPLLASVSRMDPQKGIDLIPDTLAKIDNEPWQAILLGTGIPALEAQIRRLEATFPNRVRSAIRFDRVLSHKIFAGADILMIPSRYEPCGLTQMVAMRYGCVPVARATGGLVDTIRDHVRQKLSDGFLFSEASSHSFAAALRRALHVYTNNREWEKIQTEGMSHDFSWDKSALKYLQLYKNLAKRQSPTV